MRPKVKISTPAMNAWNDLQSFCVHRISHTAEKQTRFLCRLGGDIETPCKHVNCPLKDVQLGTENLEKLYQELITIEQEIADYSPHPVKRVETRRLALKDMEHDTIILSQLKGYLKTRKEDTDES